MRTHPTAAEEQRALRRSDGSSSIDPRDGIEYIPGVGYVLAGDTKISQWVKETGKLDHDDSTLSRIQQYVKPGDTVIDVGAYIGDHTKRYLDWVGPDGVVIAFEPHPIAYRCLVRNCPEALTYQIALADGPGLLNIEMDAANPGASWLHWTRATGRPVVTASLDDFYFSPQFLKIDAEGFEYNILSAASETLENAHPTMLIEINRGALERNGDTQDDIFDFLHDHGYRWQFLHPEHNLTMEMFDVLAFPK